MQTNIAHEISIIHSLLVKICENQSVEIRSRNSVNGAIQVLESGFNSRIDRLETEIASIRSESQAVLNHIVSLLSDPHFSKKCDNVTDQSTSFGKHENCTRQIPISSKKETKSLKKDVYEKSRSESYTLSADLVFNSPATGPRSLISSPSDQYGKGETEDVDCKSDQKVRVDAIPTLQDVNRLKPLRDSVENTNPDRFEREDTDDDEEDESRAASAVLCMRAVVTCRWREILRRFFGIAKPNLLANDAGSRAIHPTSPFMAGGHRWLRFTEVLHLLVQSSIELDTRNG